MAELVTDYDETVENTRQFNTDLLKGKQVKEQLTQFKHWYYFSDLDMFGPSKFIGYKNMTSENYEFGYDKDGRDTEKVLKTWFILLEENDYRYNPLWIKLNDMISEHGKSLRKNAKLHIVKG